MPQRRRMQTENRTKLSVEKIFFRTSFIEVKYLLMNISSKDIFFTSFIISAMRWLVN
jgi:hypothetical protein